MEQSIRAINMTKEDLEPIQATHERVEQESSPKIGPSPSTHTPSSADDDITVTDVEMSLLKLDTEIDVLRGRLENFGVDIPAIRESFADSKSIKANSEIEIEGYSPAYIVADKPNPINNVYFRRLVLSMFMEALVVPLALWLGMSFLLKSWIEARFGSVGYMDISVLGSVLIASFAYALVSIRTAKIKDAVVVLKTASNLRNRIYDLLESSDPKVSKKASKPAVSE